MFDLAAVSAAIARHGRVVRVVIADVGGSAPREIGAAMLVWTDGQLGTIGGGALEFQATQAAREMLGTKSRASLTRHPLGPALGQCCGGSVTLVSECFDAKDILSLQGKIGFLRQIEGAEAAPLSVNRALRDARAQGQPPATQLVQGWLIEPLQHSTTPLWIWGAGHVGRAIVQTLAALPNFEMTWIDTDWARFPETIPDNVTALPASDPAAIVPHAPKNVQHLIMTYSHALDLDLCHRILQHDFRFAGLIGSQTKWARFQKRLSDLGHSSAQIARITCPIGDPALGKHPQAIAIGVAMQLITDSEKQLAQKDRTA